jgi:hypothetical protein
MRYKASKEHLTECLIAFRNLKTDNREKKKKQITTEVATYDFQSRQKIFVLFLCEMLLASYMFASGSILRKGKNCNGRDYEDQCCL